MLHGLASEGVVRRQSLRLPLGDARSTPLPWARGGQGARGSRPTPSTSLTAGRRGPHDQHRRPPSWPAWRWRTGPCCGPSVGQALRAAGVMVVASSGSPGSALLQDPSPDGITVHPALFRPEGVANSTPGAATGSQLASWSTSSGGARPVLGRGARPQPTGGSPTPTTPPTGGAWGPRRRCSRCAERHPSGALDGPPGRPGCWPGRTSCLPQTTALAPPAPTRSRPGLRRRPRRGRVEGGAHRRRCGQHRAMGRGDHLPSPGRAAGPGGGALAAGAALGGGGAGPGQGPQPPGSRGRCPLPGLERPGGAEGPRPALRGRLVGRPGRDRDPRLHRRRDAAREAGRRRGDGGRWPRQRRPRPTTCATASSPGAPLKRACARRCRRGSWTWPPRCATCWGCRRAPATGGCCTRPSPGPLRPPGGHPRRPRGAVRWPVGASGGACARYRGGRQLPGGDRHGAARRPSQTRGLGAKPGLSMSAFSSWGWWGGTV